MLWGNWFCFRFHELNEHTHFPKKAFFFSSKFHWKLVFQRNSVFLELVRSQYQRKKLQRRKHRRSQCQRRRQPRRKLQRSQYQRRKLQRRRPRRRAKSKRRSEISLNASLLVYLIEFRVLTSLLYDFLLISCISQFLWKKAPFNCILGR